MSETAAEHLLRAAEFRKRQREQIDAECRGAVPLPEPMTRQEYAAMLKRERTRPAGVVRVSGYNFRTSAGRRFV